VPVLLTISGTDTSGWSMPLCAQNVANALPDFVGKSGAIGRAAVHRDTRAKAFGVAACETVLAHGAFTDDVLRAFVHVENQAHRIRFGDPDDAQGSRGVKIAAFWQYATTRCSSSCNRDASKNPDARAGGCAPCSA